MVTADAKYTDFWRVAQKTSNKWSCSTQMWMRSMFNASSNTDIRCAGPNRNDSTSTSRSCRCFCLFDSRFLLCRRDWRTWCDFIDRWKTIACERNGTGVCLRKIADQPLQWTRLICRLCRSFFPHDVLGGALSTSRRILWLISDATLPSAVEGKFAVVLAFLTAL